MLNPKWKLTKINKLTLGVFNNFIWNEHCIANGGQVQPFDGINIIYGRNYSGKTTLSRLIRAFEKGDLSDKYGAPSFELTFSEYEGPNKLTLTQNDLKSHDIAFRVFNEDFIRENLKFIVNPEDGIEPFAILGEKNNAVEESISILLKSLGSDNPGQETGKFEERKKLQDKKNNIENEIQEKEKELNKKISDKITDKQNGMKYKSELFGDQNYNINKFKIDADIVLKDDYLFLGNKEIDYFKNVVFEKTIDKVYIFNSTKLYLKKYIYSAKKIIEKKINDTDKIKELLNNALLNSWAQEGMKLHKNQHKNCVFCDNIISQKRWLELEKHFDLETETTVKEINELIVNIYEEKKRVSNNLIIGESYFYSKFHDEVQILEKILSNLIIGYNKALDNLIEQLEAKKNNIFLLDSFIFPDDYSENLIDALNSYIGLYETSRGFNQFLIEEQKKAKEALRLNEVYTFINTINYSSEIKKLKVLKETELPEIIKNFTEVNSQITLINKSIDDKKSELKDEEKGAKQVNLYLNNIYGYPFLQLETKKNDKDINSEKTVIFEIMRDGKPAFHLSEGERSLIAFCYFLARLQDIETNDLMPIIWIDDPISSLDNHHVFYIYSLIISEIIMKQRYNQLFISTHNLTFLKYILRLSKDKPKSSSKNLQHFIINRSHLQSKIEVMPSYLKNYVTEFNYLFHQIYKCANCEIIKDADYSAFYSFSNNARKFLEIYFYYKYPYSYDDTKKFKLLFGESNIPAIFLNRINNEYSHLSGGLERGEMPIDIPEIQTAAKAILKAVEKDRDQYEALLKSINVEIGN